MRPGSLPDRIEPSREVQGDEIEYRFANGLVIRTEVIHKADPLRILPLGSPQFALMNHLANFPRLVEGRSVLEPFAGSGPLGLMALKLGAGSAHFLDVNPRASGFQRANAARSGIDPGRLSSIVCDVAEFRPPQRYHLLLANPPFVPTPDGIEGSLTSNGGPEGNRFIAILLRRLEELLEPDGEALVCVFQLVAEGRPLIVDLIERHVERRRVELVRSQERPLGFEAYCGAYEKLFPASGDAMERWRGSLVQRHGPELTLCHYVMHVRPRGEGATVCVLRDDFAERFSAAFRVPSEREDELAFGRVFENLVPGA